MILAASTGPYVEAAIAAVEGLSVAFAVMAVAVVLMDRTARKGPTGGLLLTVLLLTALLGLANVIEWRAELIEADFIEDLLEPLLPVLWLFLLMVALERQDRDRIAESEANLRGLIENARFSITTTNPDRRIVFWNRGAERLTGWPADEALGRDIRFIIPEDRRSDLDRDVLRQLRRDGSWFGECPILRKDGTTKTVFLTLSQIHDDRGRLMGTLGVSIDVSEQVQLREQLLQAQKMETLGALAGGIAHDFNNLLTGILGFAGILEAHLPDDTDDHEAARQIEEAAQRGTDLVRQLMTFSRKHPTRKESVDLSSLIVETRGLVERTLGSAIEVRTDIRRPLPRVQADPTQLHQVLMNLVVNARDAMPEGGTLTLRASGAELSPAEAQPLGLTPGPYVRIEVEDTGRGIPEEIRDRIFEPFFTTRSDDGGTGLGLSTAFAIVSRHDGRMTCDSTPGRGTRFTVLLPAAVPSETPEGPPGGPRLAE